MNGAENLLKTLEQAGMEVCFANPGTSEMHLVAAIGIGLPLALGASIACPERKGMGIPATRATTAEEFDAQFEEAMGKPGPRLIEAMVVQQMP